MQAYGTRKERFGDVTDLTTEETISKDIKNLFLKKEVCLDLEGQDLK